MQLDKDASIRYLKKKKTSLTYFKNFVDTPAGKDFIAEIKKNISDGIMTLISMDKKDHVGLVDVITSIRAQVSIFDDFANTDKKLDAVSESLDLLINQDQE